MGSNATITHRMTNSTAAARGIAAQRARQAAAQTPQQTPQQTPVMQTSPLAPWAVQPPQTPVKPTPRPVYAGSYTLDPRAVHWAVGVLVGMAFLMGSLIGGILTHASKPSGASMGSSTAYTTTLAGGVRQPTGAELESLRLAVTTVGKGWCALEWHATEGSYKTVCHTAAQ